MTVDPEACPEAGRTASRDGIYALLRDPRAGAPLRREPDALVAADGHRYRVRGGVADLVPEEGGGSPPGALPRWATERPLVAKVYERAWRPWVLPRLTGATHDFATELALVGALVGECLAALPGPVLDLACGSGLYTRALARRFPQRALVGMDLSRPVLEEARMLATLEAVEERVLFVRADATRLPLASGSVAAVVHLAALHEHPRPAAVLRQVRRVLGPGGVYVASVAMPPASGALRGLWRAAEALELRALAEDEAKSLLAAEGFVAYERLRLDPVLVFRVRAPRERCEHHEVPGPGCEVCPHAVACGA